MTTPNNNDSVAGASPGPGDVETEPLGLEGVDGDALDGQGDGGEGETPSHDSPANPDKSTPDDDGSDALTEALANGTTDDLDEQGGVNKPSAKPEDKKDEKKKDLKDATPKPDDKAASETKPEEALSPEEEASLKKYAGNKEYRKELKALFDERRELRKASAELEQVRPVKEFTDALVQHAQDAGLVEVTAEGKLNVAALRDLIEQEKQLRNQTPQQIAAYYRALASDLDPESVPVVIPDDLRDAVDMGTIKPEEAEILARTRAKKEKPAAKSHENEPDPRQPAAAEQQQQQRAAVEKARKDGYGDIAKVSATYKARFGAEWDEIGVAVQTRLQPLIQANANPSTWKHLAELAIEAAIAQRRQGVRTPSRTPSPQTPAPRPANEVMSEEDEVNALAHGRF